MKQKYKKIEFDLVEGRWYCYNKKSGEELGKVYYYQPWKKYVFDMKEDIVFDLSCLKDVIDFMEQLRKRK